MPSPATLVHIGLISPNDVVEERLIVEKVLNRLKPRAARLRVAFDLRRWEDTTPNYSSQGVQARILDGLKLEQCDIVIAIFWTRWGVVDTPPDSRTAGEVKRVMQHLRDTGLQTPELGIYFSQRPIAPSDVDSGFEQLKQFKEEIERTDKILYGQFDSVAQFEQQVFDRLFEYLDRLESRERALPGLWCKIDKEPALLKAESFAEPVGDITIHVKGDQANEPRPLLLDIKIEVSTNITSPLDSKGKSQVRIEDTAKPHVLAAFGTFEAALNSGNSNRMAFSPLPVFPRDGKLDTLFVVRGLRINVPQSNQPVRALVTIRKENADGDVIAHEQVWLGKPIPGMYFRADAIQSIQPSFPIGFTFIKIGFVCPVPVEDQTSMIATVSNLGAGYEVYATMFDLSFGERRGYAGIPTQAAAGIVETIDARGQIGNADFRERDSAPPEMHWEGRIPMVRLKLRQGHVAWKPTSSFGAFEFGLAVRLQESRAIGIAGGFGPFILATDDPNVWGKPQHFGSVTAAGPTRLPTPRFRTQSAPVEIFCSGWNPQL